ncbi:helix-turn-helix domain-containing protein [Clostridium fallax]|uniref:Helix-turn-helix domain-containing protein n=1 Tax=Clostridium fallax TaxID=1533 RepID=A0A1M4Y8R6_9CLOT|nr:helix-turn-helix transcriptional regulator [Clostridium fallax]SHF02217.1 Helix-turn-helix domain-containing protein [Clostridium fallax]SQB06030.1 tetratricopeptide repeat protein [Clostridium fallax]
MEILSTGEKIKRARIYKGITLKELCEDKISISKMSCIENGKVKAEPWIINIVAEKLDLDVKYLKQDVREQIEKSLEKSLNNKEDKNFEEDLKTYLSYAKDYKYYDLAFDIMHELFRFYLRDEKYDKVQDIITDYYSLYQNYSKGAEEYFKDMAYYFYKSREYIESITCINRLREALKNDLNTELDCELLFAEGICYYRLGYDDEAYSIIFKAKEKSVNIDNKLLKGQILGAFAAVMIEKEQRGAEKYMEESEILLKDRAKARCYLKETYGDKYFKIGKKDIAIKEIREALDEFPQNQGAAYGDFLNKCVGTLIKNQEFDLAQHYSEMALNIAINCNNIKLIEKAYYLKGLILQKKGMYLQSEMYMNLSLDALLKFGTKEEKYDRYLEMANMYYILNETRESLKYFTLALNLEKRL